MGSKLSWVWGLAAHSCMCMRVHIHQCHPETWRRRGDGWKPPGTFLQVQTACLQVVLGGKLLHVLTYLFRKHLLVPWVQKHQYVLRFQSNNLHFCVQHSFLPLVFSEYLLLGWHLACLLQAHMKRACAQGFCSQGGECPRWVRALFYLRPGELGGMDRALGGECGTWFRVYLTQIWI